MKEILAAIDRGQDTLHRIGLIVIFVAVTGIWCFILNFGQLLNLFFKTALLIGWYAVAIQLITWGFWFTWQGWIFPRNTGRSVQTGPIRQYRKAFYSDILPGVSLGVALMVRPFGYGVLTVQAIFPLSWWIFPAILLLALGFGLLYSGFKSIGLARAGFLYEYQSTSQRLVQRGAYAYIRHPLFLGGVIASIGASLLFHTEWTLILAIVNIAVLPIYQRIEDTRMSRLFGDEYARYCLSVGAFFPKLTMLRSLARNLLGQRRT